MSLGLGFEQVDARVGREGPVVVLPGAIDASEWFFMDEAFESMLSGHVLEDVHRDHLVIDGDVGLFEGWGQLVLAGGDLVMPSLDGDAELEKPSFDFGHIAQNSRGDGSKVVIVELVALRRRGADQGTAADHQVESFAKEILIDQEILLFASEGADDLRHVLIGAEDFQDTCRLFCHRLDRANERRLHVERLAGVTGESGWDAEGGHPLGGGEQEGRAVRIPGGVTTGLVGVTNAARGERAGVGLADDQRIARKLLDGDAVSVDRKECVMFFGG